MCCVQGHAGGHYVGLSACLLFGCCRLTGKMSQTHLLLGGAGHGFWTSLGLLGVGTQSFQVVPHLVNLPNLLY